MGDEDLYRKYIAGMNDGDPATIAELFDEDGVYVEPFSTGSPNEIRGRAAIREYFEQSIGMRPKDMTVAIDRVEVDGDVVRTAWTCASAEWDEPMRGRDEMETSGGRIRRLAVDLHSGEHP